MTLDARVLSDSLHSFLMEREAFFYSARFGDGVAARGGFFFAFDRFGLHNPRASFTEIFMSRSAINQVVVALE